MMKPVTLALALLCAAPVVQLPIFSGPASATDWDWEMGSGSPTARRHRARVHYARRHDNDATKVMAYVKRDDEKTASKDDRGFHCVDKVRGLGTQWIGTEGAMDAARKDWMERVRYDYGESFIDMTNARDFVSRCGRVSIAEVAGQVTYRCEIMARPCKAEMKETKVTK